MPTSPLKLTSVTRISAVSPKPRWLTLHYSRTLFTSSKLRSKRSTVDYFGHHYIRREPLLRFQTLGGEELQSLTEGVGYTGVI